DHAGVARRAGGAECATETCLSDSHCGRNREVPPLHDRRSSDLKLESKRDCWHSVGDFTPESERPGICTKKDACLSTEGVYCSRCVYYGKHQSFQATAGFRDYAPNAYSSSNGWSVFYQ